MTSSRWVLNGDASPRLYASDCLERLCVYVREQQIKLYLLTLSFTYLITYSPTTELTEFAAEQDNHDELEGNFYAFMVAG